MRDLNKMISVKLAAALAALLLLWSFSLFATSYDLTYGGRITSADGSPVQGPVNLEVQFYHEPSGGQGLLIEPVLFTNVPLSEGVFQLTIDLQKITASDFHRIFASNFDAWIEVSNVSEVAPVIFPRQKFSAVPFALKIPTDEKSLVYTSDGKLKVGQLQSLILNSGNSANTATLKAAGSMDESVTYTLPPTPSAGSFLKTDALGNLSWGSPSGSGDMTKASYDIDQNGVVDNAEKLGGQLPSYYQNATNISSGTIDDARLSANAQSGVGAANAGTNLNSPSTIVKRDGSGNFTAGTITANLTGNVAGNVSGSAASFTGALSGEVTGNQGSTVIANSAVTSNKIASSAITLSKIAPCANNEILKMVGLNWTCATESVSGGTITQVDTGTGLTGGPITNTGTISIANSGVGTSQIADNAVTTVKITDSNVTNVKIASGVDAAKIGSGDVSNTEFGYLDGVTSAIQTQINAKQATINSSSDIVTGGLSTAKQNALVLSPYNTAAGNTSEIRFNELAANGSEYIGFKAPDAITASKVWVLPSADGTSGQVLKTDGSGVLSWTSVSGGTMSQVDTGTGLTGGPITSTGTISIANSGVGTAQLSDNAVTTVKITDANVTNVKIASGVDAAKIGSGAVSNTEFGYLDGVTSAIQTQLDSKQSSIAAGVAAQYYRGDKTWQTLNSDAATEGSTNLYFTAARAKSAAVADSITNGVLDVAASQNAVYDALALKSDASHNHTGVYEPLGLSANVVTTTKINDGAVTTAKLADANVTFSKIAPCADGKIPKMSGTAWACADDKTGPSASPKKCNGNVCLNAVAFSTH